MVVWIFCSTSVWSVVASLNHYLFTKGRERLYMVYVLSRHLASWASGMMRTERQCVFTQAPSLKNPPAGSKSRSQTGGWGHLVRKSPLSFFLSSFLYSFLLSFFLSLFPSFHLAFFLSFSFRISRESTSTGCCECYLYLTSCDLSHRLAHLSHPLVPVLLTPAKYLLTPIAHSSIFCLSILDLQQCNLHFSTNLFFFFFPIFSLPLLITIRSKTTCILF